MKLLLLVVISLLMFSCNDQTKRIADTYEKQVKDAEAEVKKVPDVDSFVMRLQNELRFLDSNRKYYDIAFSYDMKKKDYEILYYKTENEKYRLLANKYDALRVKYAKICNHWNDSLQNSK